MLGALTPCPMKGDAIQPAAIGLLPSNQPDFGVVFYIPDDKTSDKDMLSELAEIKREGYRHVNISSWIWTNLSKGSSFRRRVDLVLDWCDRNDLGVWVLENIQYGRSEAGDFDKGVADAAGYLRPYVINWVDALRGHTCVRGFSLGNEVGPSFPKDPEKAPLYCQTFRNWLRTRYGAIGNLNKTWGSSYGAFEEIGIPAENTPGRIDMRHFATERFGKFYGAVFDSVIKPILGDKIGYGSKALADPYLYCDYPSATVLEWDDLVANEPLWVMRVLSDCDPRPLFDSEIHLYHDRYGYYPSVELVRYRYLADALCGETINSSFEWGAWTKPEIAAIHAQTPATLSEAYRLAPELHRFAEATRNARIGVLVTEPLFQKSSANLSARPVLVADSDGVRGANHLSYNDAFASVTSGSSAVVNDRPIPLSPAPLEDAYAALGTTGRSWRFVLDLDLDAQATRLDTIIVPGNTSIPNAALRDLLALPRSVQIEWAGDWPSENEYGQPLDPALLAALKARSRQNVDLYQAAGDYRDKTLGGFYTVTSLVKYGWWAPQKGSFSFSVRCPRIEARRIAESDGSTMVLLVNHTRNRMEIPSASRLPWYTAGQQIRDVTQQVIVDPKMQVILPPFDVHFFRYTK